jgi:hypothetical protein
MTDQLITGLTAGFVSAILTRWWVLRSARRAQRRHELSAWSSTPRDSKLPNNSDGKEAPHD